MANSLCENSALFSCDILTLEQLNNAQIYNVVILPPAINDTFYLNPSEPLLAWLKEQYHQQATLCSACAGAFILAKSGLLAGVKVTTHWALSQVFEQRFPHITLDSQPILINEGRIMTAGGMMSWLNLGLELVALHAGPRIMTQLGKNLVVDTGHRAQSYYQQFIPKRTHGDKAILNVQAYLDTHYASRIRMTDLAILCHKSERSFLRHFHQSTGLKPSEYIQRLRVQKACELLESTRKNFETIAREVGYEDSSACRKVFVRILGLTPKSFRQRFVR